MAATTRQAHRRPPACSPRLFRLPLELETSLVLDPGRWPEADAILERALELPAAERIAFARRAAAGDASLAANLEAILREADTHDGFLAPGGVLSGSVYADLCRKMDALDETSRLTPDAEIGSYRIVERLGRGGMGEVYRARDRRLNRDVAIKVLPQDLSEDPFRLARFEREARVLASLSHPGIARIYHLVEQEALTGLVLELVDGPTLADRLEAGPLPLDVALSVARNLAEALEAAHARGIVHRDLKPANIKLPPEGGLKVLDFGLAKALGDNAAVADDDGRAWLSTDAHVPGTILGTVAYMCPEQARGQQVDHRADIWAFGCVLFEMLSGLRPFAGGSPAEVMARVLGREPDFGRLPWSTPTAIRRLLRRCLEKDPNRRLGFVGDALLDLHDAAQPRAVEEPDAVPARRWSRAALGSAFALAVTVGAIAGIIVQRSLSPGPTPFLTRLSVALPAGDELITGSLPALAVSADGRTIVYRARRGREIRLFRRAIDDYEPVPLAGTENAAAPFVSPDGRWVGFDRDGILMTTPIAGGPPMKLAEVPGGAVGSWGPDDTIVFAAGFRRTLLRIDANGGTPRPVTSVPPDAADEAHVFPEVLPGGRTVLFTLVRGSATHVAVTTVGDVPGEISILTEGSQPHFVPPGFLVFVRQGALWSAPFDPRRQRLLTEAVPVLDSVHSAGPLGAAQYAVGASGTLVYAPRPDENTLRRLVWVDRDGRQEPLDLDPRPFTAVTLSPDGSRVALAAADRDNPDIWVYDTARRTLSRLTTDPGNDTAPVWTPDGRSIAFRSDRDGGGLFLQAADGIGSPRRLTRSSGLIRTPYAFTRDGSELLFTEVHSHRRQRIGIVSVNGTNDVRWLIDGPAAQLRPQLSPDGRWMAYQSDETGRFEVYVRPFPDTEGGKWQVSSAGGTSPTFGPDGGEMFFHDGKALQAVKIRTGTAFSAHDPATITAVGSSSERLGRVYDVSRDGRRFLMIVDAVPKGDVWARWHLMHVANWTLELDRRAREAR